MLCFKESGRISQAAWGFVIWWGFRAWPMQFRAYRERPGPRGLVSRSKPQSSKLPTGRELQPGGPIGELARKQASGVKRPASQTLWEGSTETKEIELRTVSSGSVLESLRWAVRNHRCCHSQSSEVSRETALTEVPGLHLCPFWVQGSITMPFHPLPRENYGLTSDKHLNTMQLTTDRGPPMMCHPWLQMLGPHFCLPGVYSTDSRNFIGRLLWL